MLTDQQIQDAVFAVLRHWKDDRAWDRYTRESGPYDVTSLRPEVLEIIRAVLAANDQFDAERRAVLSIKREEREALSPAAMDRLQKAVDQHRADYWDGRDRMGGVPLGASSALSYTGPDKGERPSSATCKAMSLAYDVLEAVRRDYVTGHHGFDRSSGCDYDYEVCNQCDQRDSHEPRCIVKGIEDAICALSAQLHDDPPSSPSNAGERG